MLDKIVYKFFAGLDNIMLKVDNIFYAGYEKIRSFFKRKRKTKQRKNSF